MKNVVKTIFVVLVVGLITTLFIVDKKTPPPPEIERVESVSRVGDVVETGVRPTLTNTVETALPADRADIKATAIAALDFSTEYTSNTYGVTIQVVSVSKIDDGVSVYAKAWKDGVPIGFGKNGNIETERFRIKNPPILVEDAVGKIERTYYIRDLNNQVVSQEVKKYREDPLVATLESLAHTISITGTVGGEIIAGSVGNTTDTFYPSYDAWYWNNNATSWAAVRSDTTSDDFGDADGNNTIVAQTGWTIMRQMWTWDTSSIGTDDISSATLSLMAYSAGASPDGLDIDIVVATPASSSSMAATDYDQVGSTVFGSFPITGFDTANQYEDFTFNASGLAAINKSGDSVFAGLTSADTDNSAPTDNNNVNLYMNDSAGTTKDPKLTVVHEAASTEIEQLDIIWFE